ncbi:hypothetical protein IEO21_09918 [Rhodonia placenta]|uniref:Uncharacterized protein n=1 Tax=Rhodonia placenta TaxID=104341 RepID=A0A8H7NTF9_9APHY|nr:hypothetical protein IEO21_09918 [Postia placenta]
MSLKDFAMRRKKQRQEQTQTSPSVAPTPLEHASSDVTRAVESPDVRTHEQMPPASPDCAMPSAGLYTAPDPPLPTREASPLPGQERARVVDLPEDSDTRLSTPVSLHAKVELLEQGLPSAAADNRSRSQTPLPPEPPPPPKETSKRSTSPDEGTINTDSKTLPIRCQEPAHRTIQEDGEILSPPPPKAPSYLARSRSPPTHPRSFHSSGAESSHLPPRRPLYPAPHRAMQNTAPPSRPLPSGPRALRTQNYSTYPPTLSIRAPPGVPRGPSADRDRPEWDRERGWPGPARGRGRGMSGGWMRPETNYLLVPTNIQAAVCSQGIRLEEILYNLFWCPGSCMYTREVAQQDQAANNNNTFTYYENAVMSFNRATEYQSRAVELSWDDTAGIFQSRQAYVQPPIKLCPRLRLQLQHRIIHPHAAAIFGRDVHDDAATGRHKMSTGAAVGGAVGGMLGLVALLMAAAIGRRVRVHAVYDVEARVDAAEQHQPWGHRNSSAFRTGSELRTLRTVTRPLTESAGILVHEEDVGHIEGGSIRTALDRTQRSCIEAAIVAVLLSLPDNRARRRVRDPEPPRRSHFSESSRKKPSCKLGCEIENQDVDCNSRRLALGTRAESCGWTGSRKATSRVLDARERRVKDTNSSAGLSLAASVVITLTSGASILAASTAVYFAEASLLVPELNEEKRLSDRMQLTHLSKAFALSAI